MSEINKITTEKIKYIANNFKNWSVKESVGDKQYIWFCEFDEPDLSYEFNSSRMGVCNDGRFVWQGTSGCSCPSPYDEGFDEQDYAEIGETINLEDKGWRGGYLSDTWKNELTESVERIYLALKSPEKLTAEQVLKEDNTELRRVLIEKIGMERFVELAKPEILDEDEKVGKLLRIKLAGDEDIVLLNVKDSSTDRMYLLRVPPKTKTALEAKAWTFGMEPSEFILIKET